MYVCILRVHAHAHSHACVRACAHAHTQRCEGKVTCRLVDHLCGWPLVCGARWGASHTCQGREDGGGGEASGARRKKRGRGQGKYEISIHTRQVSSRPLLLEYTGIHTLLYTQPSTCVLSFLLSVSFSLSLSHAHTHAHTHARTHARTHACTHACTQNGGFTLFKCNSMRAKL